MADDEPEDEEYYDEPEPAPTAKGAAAASKAAPKAPGKAYDELDFGETYESKSFLEKLTELALQSVAADIKDSTGERFEPARLLAKFDAHLVDLSRMATRSDATIAGLEEELALAEENYLAAMEDMKLSSTSVYEEFAELDKNISTVGEGAVRIGARLQHADAQRSRAVEASALIRYFNQFNSGEPETYADMFQWETNPAAVHEAAPILKQLSELSQELDIDGVNTARSDIHTYSEKLEETVLAEFKEARANDDHEAMRTCARTLHDFNGGGGCIDEYLSRHAYFEAALDLEKPLERLYEEALVLCQAEHEAVDDIFPQGQLVIQQFINRLLHTKVEPAVAHALEAAQSSGGGIRGYLRELFSARQKTFAFAVKLEGMKLAEFAVVKSVEHMFATPQEEYISKELQSLEELAAGLVAEHTKHLNTDKKGKGLFSRKKTVVNDSNAPVVSVSIGQEFSSIYTEAIERTLALSPSETERTTNVQSIFLSLLNAVGQDYLMKVLTHVLAGIPRFDSKVSPLEVGAADFFAATALVNDIVVMLQEFYRTSVQPHIETAVNARSVCMNTRARVLGELEERITEGMHKCLTGFVNQAKTIMKAQPSEDYKPKEDMPDMITTPTCNALSAFLKAARDVVSRDLDRANRDRFLIAMGSKVQEDLVHQLKKHVVNTAGGLKLVRDLSQYQDTIRSYEIRPLDESFELLREIGNLFLVAPQNLKPIINESVFLSKMDRQEVMTYIKQRQDYKQISSQLKGLF